MTPSPWPLLRRPVEFTPAGSGYRDPAGQAPPPHGCKFTEYTVVCEGIRFRFCMCGAQEQDWASPVRRAWDIVTGRRSGFPAYFPPPGT
jgi:hypothetical protein